MQKHRWMLFSDRLPYSISLMSSLEYLWVDFYFPSASYIVKNEMIFIIQVILTRNVSHNRINGEFSDMFEILQPYPHCKFSKSKAWSYFIYLRDFKMWDEKTKLINSLLYFTYLSFNFLTGDLPLTFISLSNVTNMWEYSS